jgi:glycyl-tRNA synthetase beta chain
LFHTIKQRVDAVNAERHSDRFKALAMLFKRVKNIAGDKQDDGRDWNELKAALKEPAELELADAMMARLPLLEKAESAGRFTEAVGLLADLQPFVDRFFKDVLVMTDDLSLREARLILLVRLYREIRQKIGDISVLVPDEKQT